MDLEKATKKRDKVAGTVNMRIRSVDTLLLKESEDIVKLTAGKTALLSKRPAVENKTN